jgi:pyruvate,water dikinase
MRTVSRAQLILRDSFVAPQGARAGLDGDGIGAETYRGRAVVAADPADALMRLEPGEVLVAYGTTPAFNMALSIAGAVVVEEGGLLSHAAVIARELGLPAVIGTAGCMTEIADGALVEVDPVRGQVRVLAGSAWIES